MLDDDTTSAIVTDTGLGNGQVLGMFAAPNFLNDVLSAGLDFRTTPVQDVMDASVEPLWCDATYLDVCYMLQRSPDAEFTVVDSLGERTLLGTVPREALERALEQHLNPGLLSEGSALDKLQSIARMSIQYDMADLTAATEPWTVPAVAGNQGCCYVT